MPSVDGLVLVLASDSIEPAMGKYEWATVDQWMSTAVSSGKKVELSVRADMAPSWLFQPVPNGAGANPLSFSYAPHDDLKRCTSEIIAAPWDPAFLARRDAMLAALAAHLKATGTYNTVPLLRLTGINRNSDELHLPSQTPQSSGLTCVSDAITTWMKAGYRPSLLLKAWDAITTSFKKSFPDKTFSIAIIASTNPFPPIAEDGSVISFTSGQSLSPSQNLPLLTLAGQKFPGHLVIQNNTLYPGVTVPSQTVQSAQTLGTMIAFQTNEDFGGTGGASCGPTILQTAPCTDSTFLQELESGIYPLGKSNNLRAQYIEVFPANVNALPTATLQAHFELAPPVVSLVANAEGESSTIAPNTWVEIKGAGLSLTGDARMWKAADFVNSQLPKQLDGVGVTVNGKAAYVYYVSPTQINTLTPPDPMTGPVQVQIAVNGAASDAFTAQARAVSPSFFVFNGGPYGAATHANGSYLGPAGLYPGSTTPAKPGEVVVLYASFEPTSAPVVSGSLLQSGVLSPLPEIKIGDVAATVQFAELVSPGEFQFNVVVPLNTPDGDQPITASYNGVATQAGTLIAVQR